METELHPVQTTNTRHGSSMIPKEVTMRAYEVYSHVFAPQEAMIKDGCRGGFSVGELIAFLYAYPFPKDEWDRRVHEVFNKMQNL